MKGGLRVISLREQVRALIAKIFLWTIVTSNHPLQLILRRRICQMLEKKWGCVDLSWTFVPCETLSVLASPLLTNLCKFWNKTKKAIQYKTHVNEEERGGLVTVGGRTYTHQ